MLFSLCPWMNHSGMGKAILNKSPCAEKMISERVNQSTSITQSREYQRQRSGCCCSPALHQNDCLFIQPREGEGGRGEMLGDRETERQSEWEGEREREKSNRVRLKERCIVKGEWEWNREGEGETERGRESGKIRMKSNAELKREVEIEGERKREVVKERQVIDRETDSE